MVESFSENCEKKNVNEPLDIISSSDNNKHLILVFYM